MNKIKILLLALCLVAPSVFAAEIEGFTVSGNNRVEDSTVLSYIPVRVGQPYEPSQISQSIKALYATGLFDNVSIGWNNSVFNIEVKENPLVNKVAFEGNDNLDDERLKQLISLRSRTVFTPAKVQADVQEILAAYRQTGRFTASVDPQLIQRSQNRVDVVYKVDEGEKTKIKSIRFVGNKRFSDNDLRNVIRTKESRWWRFLTVSDSYDPDRIEVDKEMLRREYIKTGYADFKVISAITELSADKKSFYITFTVSEGPTYTFGTVDVRLNTPTEGLSRDDLKQVLTLKRGELYNGERVDNNATYLFDYMGSKGFAFLDVEPRFQRNEAERTVDIVYNINPGPRVYVNRIDIRGNSRTKDHVIRREMRFAEGDAFSTNKLKRSRDRLTFLDYFSNVEVQKKETEEPDKVDLEVVLEEQSTGEFNIGAGYSTYEGALANASLRERNFLGRGQDLSFAFSVSGRRQDFDISFTEPWFLGQELSAGVDLFNRERDFDESSYEQGLSGLALRLGFPLSEFLSNTIRLGYKDVEIDNVETDASKFVARQEGNRSSATLENTLAYDTRDSALLPTHGKRIALTTEYSGLFSDTNFVRAVLSGSWHKQLRDDVVLSLGSRIGAVEPLNGERLPVYEYFQGGGRNFRGFDNGGIGPRDAITDDALGGKYMLGNNAELSFPISGLTEFGVHGILFADGGIVTEFDDEGLGGVTDSQSYRVSVGTGIFWRSPLGPLRLEFGIPVVKEDEDNTRIFSFSFGTRF